ncbi:hypothetical protein L6164_021522 [Bauhinia variegata]|uniref:Uncharacterized protein n=1 Tax=Bauhinia variegata TaxID=167791 RepID=A0ACB9MZB2_BAUVA|nr:hypothetical protein L6164_021522 [Bauhinia variegata]
MESHALQQSLKRLRDLSSGALGQQLGALTAKGLRAIEAKEGFLLCSFIIHSTLSDENGNWHVGAIATLVDALGNLAVHSLLGCVSVTVDFSVSFFSTAKVQEEVELEAKVLGKKDKLTYGIVTVRKKENGELVALGKQWMAPSPSNTSQSQRASKL